MYIHMPETAKNNIATPSHADRTLPAGPKYSPECKPMMKWRKLGLRCGFSAGRA